MLVSYYLPCLNLLFPSNKINPIIIKIIGQNFPKSKSGKKLLARNRKPKIINKLPPISPDFTSPLMLIVCLAVFYFFNKIFKSGIVSSSVSWISPIGFIGIAIHSAI